jgi:hypothetical protein
MPRPGPRAATRGRSSTSAAFAAASLALLLAASPLASPAAAQQIGAWSPAIGAFGDWRFSTPVADEASLPASGAPAQCRYAIAETSLCCWSGSAWACFDPRSKLVVDDDDASITTTATPTDSATPVVWVKADALALNDGDPVTSWTDSSGSGHHLVQATEALQPTFQTSEINGLPVVRFDGGDCLADPAVELSTFSLFVVFAATVAGMVYEHSPNVNGSDGSYLYGDKSNTITAKRGGVQSARNLIAWTEAGAQTSWSAHDRWHVATQSFGGTHRSHRLLLNGAAPIQSTGTAGMDPGSGATTQELNVGCRDESDLFLTGDVAELIVFSPRLSSARERAVLLYLQTKYDL